MDWMTQQEINSGFKKVNSVLLKFYLKSLQNGCDSFGEENQPEEKNIMQLQKPQQNIKEESYKGMADSKSIADHQSKTPRGPTNSELKSPSNMQSQFSYLKLQKQQNYITELIPDNADQEDEPTEIPMLNADNSLYTKMPSKHLHKQLAEPTNQTQLPQIVEAKQTAPKWFQTLKFDDVIFLKFKYENKKESDRLGLRSYMVITNTRNQLECLSEEVESLDNPIANFRRCLFQIMNPRQILGLSNLGQGQNYSQSTQSAGTVLKKRVQDVNRTSFTGLSSIESVSKVTTCGSDHCGKDPQENEDEEGDQLVYGNQVMFYHQYSKMFLTFNPLRPAKQNGCIQCTLEKLPNQYSVFRMLPNDYSRRVGDKIFDSDVINIQEIKKGQFFLNVSLAIKILKVPNDNFSWFT